MYALAEPNQFLEATDAKGTKDIIYGTDVASDAMIQHIVARAKKIALKRAPAGGERGIQAPVCAGSAHQASASQGHAEHPADAIGQPRRRQPEEQLPAPRIERVPSREERNRRPDHEERYRTDAEAGHDGVHPGQHRKRRDRQDGANGKEDK